MYVIYMREIVPAGNITLKLSYKTNNNFPIKHIHLPYFSLYLQKFTKTPSSHMLENIRNYILVAMTSCCLGVAAASCGSPDAPSPDGGKPEGEGNKPSTSVSISPLFAKGADVSWLSEIEDHGFKYRDSKGNATDCMVLLRNEVGMNAIRLRVWVDPASRPENPRGWSSPEDMLKLARRAKSLGFRLMIDFHLSDWWADPGKQYPPKAWEGFTPAQTAQAVKTHITNVLSMLKEENITPEWVQVGNEVTNGMLWESGRMKDKNAGSFPLYLNSGYDAVKAVFPKAKVIVHIDNGFDAGLYTWFFNLLNANKGKYDMIGMSLYPEREWGSGASWGVAADWNKVAGCIANIKAVSKAYGKKVMLCEIGMHHTLEADCEKAIDSIISEFKDASVLEGVFYWEPETDPTDPKFNNYNKGAFKNGRPTRALAPFSKYK